MGSELTKYILIEIYKDTSTKMYKPFLVEFDQRYGPYAHFGYWTLISDP